MSPPKMRVENPIDWDARQPGGVDRGDMAANLMTIREAFTMAALQGLCASDGRNMGVEWCAHMAVKMADRALVELRD